MKESLLNVLVCPDCRERPSLDARKKEGEEVIEGFLVSACGRKFPIIGGVPRMLPPHLLSHLPADYPDFFRTYAADLAGIVEEKRDVQRHTQEAFGFEWTWAADYDADNFADWLPDGFTSEKLFKDKVGIEIGCGAGRHAERTSQYAKEHIAVDLSRAVDSAFPRNRDKKNCHVVQADCFALPFREGSFDYVYCLGVLQHMHDPPAGFRHLAKYPRSGGVLLVNVYQYGRRFLLAALEAFRKLTTRMSNEGLKRLSYFCGVIDYAFILPWKLIKPTGLGKKLERFVPGRINEYAKHDFHTCVVDWFDRLSCPVKQHYTREQLAGWYNECGYGEITVTPYWKAFWNGYGVRK